MYETIYFTTNHGAAGQQKGRAEREVTPSEMLRRRHASNSRPQNAHEPNGRRQHPEGRSEGLSIGAQGVPSQTRDADHSTTPPLPRMAYDESLTTTDACLRLWIAVVLIDKERGDRLTAGERQILSMLGVETSWVQRLIDKAPCPGKVFRSGFL